MNDRPISKFFLNLPLYAIIGALLYYATPFFWTASISNIIPVRKIADTTASKGDKNIVFELEDPMSYPNVEAYCNGVYLGTTPLRIPLEEFKRKVPVWNRPPRQERVVLHNVHNETDATVPRESYKWSQFSYAPRDDAFLYTMEGDMRQYSISDIELAATNQYWLQLRKNGCLGILTFGINDITGSGSKNEITISYQPRVEFPSHASHLHLALLALRHRRYQPDRLWIEHVLAYKDLLIDDLIAASKSDERLQPALDALLAKEFDIPEKLDESQCKRILDDVLNRAEAVGFFRIPSLEAMALELVAPTIPACISQKYKEALNDVSSHYRKTTEGSGINKIIRYQKDGRAARQLPLEHAIRLFHPPQIYNRLVYEYAKSQRRDSFVSLLSEYSDRNSRRLLRNRLGRLSQRNRLPLDLLQTDDPVALSIKSKFSKEANNNPLAMRNTGIHIPKELYGLDASDKEKCIHIFKSDLSDRDKIARLSRVHDDAALQAAMKLIESDSNNREILIYELSEIPNPVFEDFLIQQAKRTDIRSRGNFSEMHRLLAAFYRANTPKTRDAIVALCESNRDALFSFVSVLHERDVFDPLLIQWTKFLSTLTDAELRKQAIDILIAIDTDESRAALSEWANDPDDDFRNTVRRKVGECEETKERIRKLLSGEMTPDDLLPTSPAYVWNGEDYVKEGEKNAPSP